MASAMVQWWRGAVAARRVMKAAERPYSTMMRSAGVEVCGRGDKKTKRGKRFKGSYGNARPKKKQMIERLKDKLELPRSTPWPLTFNLI